MLAMGLRYPDYKEYAAPPAWAAASVSVLSFTNWPGGGKGGGGVVAVCAKSRNAAIQEMLYSPNWGERLQVGFRTRVAVSRR